jgi:hypothetical protein
VNAALAPLATPHALDVRLAVTQQGELLAGYLESAWAWSGPIGNYGMHSDTGGSYGFQRRSQIRYTFNAPEGFFGVLSLEDNNRAGRPASGCPTSSVSSASARLGAVVYGAFGYDAVDESWAARVGAQLNVPNAPGSSLIGTFYWANSVDNAYAPSMYYAALANSGGSLVGCCQLRAPLQPAVRCWRRLPVPERLRRRQPARPHRRCER